MSESRRDLDDEPDADDEETPTLKERLVINDNGEIKGVDKASDALATIGAFAVFAPTALIGLTVQRTTKLGAEIIGTLLPLDGMWRLIATWAIEQLHKNSDGDAVGFRIEDDLSVTLASTKLKDGGVEDGEPVPSGWHFKDTERTWAETADGRDICRLGDAPIGFFPSSSTRRVSPLEAEVKAALDSGNWQHVFEVQKPNSVQMDVTLDARGDDAAGAIADGGYDAELRDVQHAVLDDTLVDISEDQRVSMQKVAETYRTKSDAERMDEQQRLGVEAGRVDAEESDMEGFVIKVLLIALALVAAATIGPDLLGAAANSSSGGGGLVPFTLGLWGL